MSAVQQSTKVTHEHRYEVPAPACWTDVLMAVRMAVRDLKAARGMPENSEPSDDAVMVRSVDDESVVVYWTEEVKA